MGMTTTGVHNVMAITVHPVQQGPGDPRLPQFWWQVIDFRLADGSHHTITAFLEGSVVPLPATDAAKK
jgi:hypothetical protein